MIIKSLDHLNTLSKKVADRVVENDNIFLIGEIEDKKTTFTRYFINYLQQKEGVKVTEVLSPTFNLLYEYNLKNYKILHYDLYRINQEKELNNLGLFQEEASAVKIIEWPNVIQTPLSDKLEIFLDYAKKENEREVRFLGTGKWEDFK